MNYSVPAWQAGLTSVLIVIGFYFSTIDRPHADGGAFVENNNMSEDTAMIYQSRAIKADKELLHLFTGVR